MTTENNAAQPVLTDTQIENIRIRAEKDSRRFGRTVDIPLQADLLLALLSKLRAPVADERALPPMPKPTVIWHSDFTNQTYYGYIADDMRAYARAYALASAPVAGEAQPAAWVAADTLNSPHPTCISSLAYMSQLDRERGREYVPLYAAPQASEADIIEDVAKQWDGCIYDAGPGGDIDIGKAIRNAASKHKGHRALKSTPAPTAAEGSEDDMLTIAYLAGAQAEKERAAVLAGRRERAEDDLPAFMQSRMTPWGLLVQACRIVVGTTLMDMSRELGIRPSSLSSYEHGRKGLNDHFVIEVMRFFEDRGLCIPATSWRKAAIAATQAEQGERDAG